MDDRLRQHIGEQVRAARRARGLTQEDLAARIGRTTESISNLERAKTTPTLTTLTALAAALDLSLHDFFPVEPGVGAVSERRVRLEIEMQAREMLKILPDDHLAIAVRQLAALLGK